MYAHRSPDTVSQPATPLQPWSQPRRPATEPISIPTNSSWPPAPDAQVMTISPESPFAVPSRRVFVRKCYDELYTLAFPHPNDDLYTRMFCLPRREDDVVTIIGSPGVGKSMFLAYTFERVRVEKPEAVVVVAAFDSRSQATSLAIAWPSVVSHSDADAGNVQASGQDPTRKVTVSSESSERMLCEVQEAIVRAQDLAMPCILLFDGSPNRLLFTPRDDQDATIRTVCCMPTSDLEPWLQRVTHTRSRGGRAMLSSLLCMPPWTCDELLTAAAVLDLTNPFGTEAVARRFGVFGGVADFCLLGDAQGFFESSMASAILNTFGPRDLCRLLTPPTSCDDARDVRVRQQLLHVVAVHDGCPDIHTASSHFVHVETRLASTFVKQLLHYRVLLLATEERADFINWLCRQPHLVLIADEFAWTAQVHARLVEGGEIHVKTIRCNYMFLELKESMDFHLQPNSDVFGGHPDQPLSHHCYHPFPAVVLTSLAGFCKSPRCPVRQSTLWQRVTGNSEEEDRARTLQNVMPNVLLFVVYNHKASEPDFCVSATAMTNALEHLGMLGDTYTYAAMVALVVVCPRGTVTTLPPPLGFCIDYVGMDPVIRSGVKMIVGEAHLQGQHWLDRIPQYVLEM